MPAEDERMASKRTSVTHGRGGGVTNSTDVPQKPEPENFVVLISNPFVLVHLSVVQDLASMTVEQREE